MAGLSKPVPGCFGYARDKVRFANGGPSLSLCSQISLSQRGSDVAALAFWTQAGISRPVACALGLLSLWQLRCAIGRRVRAPVILRLGGFLLGYISFCRGWLATLSVKMT